MIRFNYSNGLKLVSLILILSILACSAPARQNNSEDKLSMTPDKASMMLTGLKTTRLMRGNDIVFEGHIIGWNKQGFIGQINDRVITIKYDLLGNTINIETEQTLSGKGALTGGGIGMLAGLFIAVIGSTCDMNRDGKDDNPLWYIKPVFIIAACGSALGAGIGTFSKKYREYEYNKEEFINKPFETKDKESS